VSEPVELTVVGSEMEAAEVCGDRARELLASLPS